MSGNIYIIQLATISVKVTRQASYTGIYIFTVLILLFVQIVLMAKRRVPVRWSPRGGRRKVCYHIALSSLKDIQGKKNHKLNWCQETFLYSNCSKLNQDIVSNPYIRDYLHACMLILKLLIYSLIFYVCHN